MHFEREATPSTDSQDFSHRLKVQAALQTQELVQLLEQRVWVGEAINGHHPMPLLQRIQQWMARQLQLRTPTESLVGYMPPTEAAIQVIEVEYEVKEVAVPPSDDGSVAKEGMP
jgi:hypothetical protein